MGEHLLPCPFCGNTSLNRGYRFEEGSSVRTLAVRCSGCGVQGPEASWNTRAEPLYDPRQAQGYPSKDE